MRLGEKFIQLKKFLTIKHTVQPETHEVIEELRNAVTKLQEDVNAYKTVAETITEKNQDLEEQMAEMRKLDRETLKEIERLKQVYRQGMQELEMELKKEGTRVSHLSKIIQPLIKRQMRKLGQKVGEEIKQTQR